MDRHEKCKVIPRVRFKSLKHGFDLRSQQSGSHSTPPAATYARGERKCATREQSPCLLLALEETVFSTLLAKLMVSLQKLSLQNTAIIFVDRITVNFLLFDFFR